MRLDDARDLRAGDGLVMTNGEPVTFVELIDRGAPGRRDRRVAIVERRDGTRVPVRPVSLHHPASTPTQRLGVGGWLKLGKQHWYVATKADGIVADAATRREALIAAFGENPQTRRIGPGVYERQMGDDVYLICNREEARKRGWI